MQSVFLVFTMHTYEDGETISRFYGAFSSKEEAEKIKEKHRFSNAFILEIEANKEVFIEF